MYRSSSEYQFAAGNRPTPQRRPQVPRRSSINDLIEKFEVSNTTQYRRYQQPSLEQIYSGQMTVGNSEDYYDDSVFYDEVVDDEPKKEPQSRTARALLPIWLLIRPVLEMVASPIFFSVTGTGIFALIATFVMPRGLSQLILYPVFRLLFGTLYPAYASYKAVKTKNVKEYVKWMMYWIVFAFFTCIETFTDIFLSWFPFYYEIKVVLVIWLLSPATKGSSTLYRKFVHPMLTRREQEIDEYITQAKEKGYTAVLQLGSKGVNYATNVIMQTAIKGGGGLVQSIRRSYSLSDLSEPDSQRSQDDIDVVMRPQRVLRSKNNTRSMPPGRGDVNMSFPELDLQTKHRSDSVGSYNYIRSTDDISSGYSSAEPGLSRTASISSGSKVRLRSKNRSEDEELRSETQRFSEKEVIYSRFDPNTQGHVYFTDPERVTLLRPSELFVGGTAGSSEEPLEDRLGAQRETEGEKYRMFLKWLESQEAPKVSQEAKEPETEPLTPVEPVVEPKVEEKLNIEPPKALEPILDPPEAILEPPKVLEPVLEPIVESFDEFLDVLEDDDDDPSTVSEPTVKSNPDYLQNLIEKAEKLAENLPKVDPSVPETQDSTPKEKPEPDIPKEVMIGQTLIQLEAPSSPEPSSDEHEEVVLESKLTISNSQLELQTTKTGSSGSQTSLNLLVPKPEPTPSLASSGSQSSLTDKKPALHSKGKAPPVPPVPPKAAVAKPKKTKILSSITGMFRSDGSSSSRDSSSSHETPRETQI